MDPNGGINPSSPRLDSNPAPQAQSQPVPQQVFTPQPPVTAPVIQTPIAPTPPQPVPSFVPPTVPDPLGGSNDLGVSSEPSGFTGGKGKTIALIAIGSILVLAITVGAFFVGNVTGKSAGRKAADAEYQKAEADRQRQEAESEAEQDEEEAQLDLGTELVEPKYVDENVEGDIGKQLTASDGLVLKVVNIERNFKTDDPNYKLDPTKELVKVNFLMGNIANDKPKDITSFAFHLLDSSNARLTPQSIASYTDKFDTIKLDQGAQAKGSIVYLVNKDEVPLKFVREQRYRFAGANREVTTKTIINVAE